MAHCMGYITLLVSVSPLYFCVAKGTDVFVRTGKDLLLDLNKDEENHSLTWFYDDIRTIIGPLTLTIVKRFSQTQPKFFNGYESRAIFFAQNDSLLLKNVQLSDSGVYTAHVTSDSVTDVAKYKLTVQDPVSRVELKVKFCSSDSSNLTVICRTLDSNISSTFTCRNQTCSHDGGEGTTPGASLDVYLENGSVICNHSNHVSSEKDVMKIEDLCEKTPESHVAATVTTVVIILIIIMLLVVGAVLYRCWKRQCHPIVEVCNR
ncbi:uncharacterized protein LOC121520413 isoform X2 [Cheilinus undulatus]|uniref:uncharacterized protein LOC121520413 isoform X2 n=1 Tax=Cheilinus undulatus TaxID=241271 RepID=UPI001BD4CB68|nr:uncharacterized protein LOC121520413 isoform X2 [Cheilinus undulatus]